MSEQLARQFHEAYERLAPSFGYETRTETRAFDPYTPNGRLMIAVCAEIDRANIAKLTESRATTDLLREQLAEARRDNANLHDRLAALRVEHEKLQQDHRALSREHEELMKLYMTRGQD